MKRTILGISAIVFTGIAVSIFSGKAFAYRGDPNIQGPNCTPERHEAMENAFENNDYNAWKNLMQGKGRVTQVVNASNFTKFAQAYKLAKQGKTAEAAKLRQELGLGLQNGSGMGKGMGFQRFNNK